MRLRYKPWADSLVSANKDIALREEDYDKVLPFSELEIGSGLGEFLIQKAYKNPDISYLGIEVCYTAFACAIKKLLQFEKDNNIKLKNIQFLNTPFEKFQDQIKNESLDAIYLNFNDPWPKKRHHKRRLTYITKLDVYYNLLKKGGKVLYKSDNDLYYEDSKKYFTIFNKFDYTFIDDYEFDSKNDEMSEYEQKFRAKNKSIHRIIGVK